MARFGGGGWFIELTGFNRLLQAFDDYEARARALRGKDWIVGSVADHSRHVEWGDRHRPGKHLLTRAIENVARAIGNDPGQRQRLARGLFVGNEEMIGIVARLVRDEAIRLTVTEDAVDTGELRDSWTARRAR